MTDSKRFFALTLLAVVLHVPVSAQVDLSGSWAYRSLLGNVGGPRPVDYEGLPLNDAGRARALSYSESQLSMPERQCMFYAPTYLMIGPFGIKMWNETNPDSGITIAWKIAAWEDRAPMTIWMDGRPHPSKNAYHDKGGFTTGVWEHEILTTYTTHMKANMIRRNGTPSSDQTTMTVHFIRHDDLLTLTATVEDPIYLSEPIHWTRMFQLDPEAPIASAGPPCTQADEGPPEGAVPHYLPGKNPFIDEMTRLYNIPEEAVLGGAETMYPEFRKKIKDKYVIPGKCVRDCGTPTGR
jgi:hypothetical protein